MVVLTDSSGDIDDDDDQLGMMLRSIFAGCASAFTNGSKVTHQYLMQKQLIFLVTLTCFLAVTDALAAPPLVLL